MKLINRAAVLLSLLFSLCALSAGQVLIQTASVATTPAGLDSRAFRSVKLAPGPNILTIDIDGTYAGQFALQVAYQGTNGTLRTWPSASIANSLTVGSTGIAANANGAWSTTVYGPGYAYLVCTAYTSGSPVVFFSVGQGGSGSSAESAAVSNGKLKIGKPLTLLGAAAGATNGSVASGAHLLSRIIGDNASSTTLYLMIFDASSLPSNGTAPIAQCMVSFGILTSPIENTRSFGEDWIANATGLWYAWSTTSGTLTLASSGTGLGLEVYGG